MEYIIVILALHKLLVGWFLLLFVPPTIATAIYLGGEFIRNKIFSEIEYLENINSYLFVTLLIIGTAIGVFFVYYDVTNNENFADRDILYNVLSDFYNKHSFINL
jgi:hypothetical protein